MNHTVSVCSAPGGSVSGSEGPLNPNPLSARVAEEIRRSAVPALLTRRVKLDVSPGDRSPKSCAASESATFAAATSSRTPTWMVSASGSSETICRRVV